MARQFERLFCLEFMVKEVCYETNLDVDDNFLNTLGPTVVELCSDNFPIIKISEDESYPKGPFLSTQAIFRSGKSCFFSISQTDDNESLNDKVNIIVSRKFPEGGCSTLYGCGTAYLKLPEEFVSVMDSPWPCDVECVKVCLDIYNDYKEIIGNISIFLRLTYFGCFVFTKFRMTESKTICFGGDMNAMARGLSILNEVGNDKRDMKTRNGNSGNNDPCFNEKIWKENGAQDKMEDNLVILQRNSCEGSFDDSTNLLNYRQKMNGQPNVVPNGKNIPCTEGNNGYPGMQPSPTFQANPWQGSIQSPMIQDLGKMGNMIHGGIMNGTQNRMSPVGDELVPFMNGCLGKNVQQLYPQNNGFMNPTTAVPQDTMKQMGNMNPAMTGLLDMMNLRGPELAPFLKGNGCFGQINAPFYPQNNISVYPALLEQPNIVPNGNELFPLKKNGVNKRFEPVGPFLGKKDFHLDPCFQQMMQPPTNYQPMMQPPMSPMAQPMTISPMFPYDQEIPQAQINPSNQPIMQQPMDPYGQAIMQAPLNVLNQTASIPPEFINNQMPTMAPMDQPMMHQNMGPFDVPMPTMVPMDQPMVQPNMGPCDLPMPTMLPMDQPMVQPNMMQQPMNSLGQPMMQSRNDPCEPPLMPSHGVNPCDQPMMPSQMSPFDQPMKQGLTNPFGHPMISPPMNPCDQPSMQTPMIPFAQMGIMQPPINPFDQSMTMPLMNSFGQPMIHPTMNPCGQPGMYPQITPFGQPMMQQTMNGLDQIELPPLNIQPGDPFKTLPLPAPGPQGSCTRGQVTLSNRARNKKEQRC